MAQAFGAEVQAAVLDVLRHHQALLGEHAVQATHGNPHLAGDGFRAEFLGADVLVDEAQGLAEHAFVHVLLGFGGAQGRAQQADHRLQRGFAFRQAEAVLAGGFEDQPVGQHRHRRAGRDALGAAHAGEAQALLHQVARQDQRQLAGVLAVDEVAGQGGIDQGDVAGPHLDAAARLLHTGVAIQLDGQVEVLAVALRHFLLGAEQARLGHVHEAQLDGAGLVFADGPGEFRTQQLGAEAPADLVDTLQPLVEVVRPHCMCCRHGFLSLTALFLSLSGLATWQAGFTFIRDAPPEGGLLTSIHRNADKSSRRHRAADHPRFPAPRSAIPRPWHR
ncbi:hypothetical protein D9M70_324320 [compost metagenome]